MLSSHASSRCEFFCNSIVICWSIITNHILLHLDDSQDRGNFLIDGALLHRSGDKNTHNGIPSTTATDGVSLSLSVMEVVENLGSEAKIVGITSDGGGNL